MKIGEEKIEVKAEKIDKAYKKYKSLLNQREREILTKYYGIEKQVRHSLSEIGKIYGVTRERIRQIKVKALTKIQIKK
jgi:RNA polymerase primary sigma factor